MQDDHRDMCYAVSIVGKAQGSVKDHHKDAGAETRGNNGRARSEKDFINTETGQPSHRGLGEITGQGDYR